MVRPGSWGHLPNGGTVANLEALWAARYSTNQHLPLYTVHSSSWDCTIVEQKDYFHCNIILMYSILLHYTVTVLQYLQNTS